ncbi:hypothetical protein LDENG_00066440 [Lucifuga dentata]|nr:hypothetical protein LDENG_00066440 [Lucifuga dentata]
MTGDTGVFGRAVDTRGFHSQAPRIDESHRREIAETHRERCVELAAPWLENTQPAADNATLIPLRVRPLSPGGSQGMVFPGKPLFSFVRRVYRCCQEGFLCRRVKGIQGRIRRDTDVEFLLTREILSITIVRAELHLQLSNPQCQDIHPVLSSMAKRNLPTRFNLWSHGNTVEMRVDLLFLFQDLQEEASGSRGGPSLLNIRSAAFSSPAAGSSAPRPVQDMELNLVLGCSRDGSAASCEDSGVHLLHTPFVALSYR